MQRNCICCEKSIKHCGPDGEDCFSNPPNDATVWTSHGNYGSTLYDPMDGKDTLETFICDECLKKKAKFIYRYDYVKQTTTEVKNLRVFDVDE